MKTNNIKLVAREESIPRHKQIKPCTFKTNPVQHTNKTNPVRSKQTLYIGDRKTEPKTNKISNIRGEHWV